MAAVARAGPHRRMKDDQVVAHYARAGDGSAGVIRIGQLAERVVVALPRPCILRRRVLSSPTGSPGASVDFSDRRSPASRCSCATTSTFLRMAESELSREPSYRSPKSPSHRAAPTDRLVFIEITTRAERREGSDETDAQGARAARSARRQPHRSALSRQTRTSRPTLGPGAEILSAAGCRRPAWHADLERPMTGGELAERREELPRRHQQVGVHGAMVPVSGSSRSPGRRRRAASPVITWRRRHRHRRRVHAFATTARTAGLDTPMRRELDRGPVRRGADRLRGLGVPGPHPCRLAPPRAAASSTSCAPPASSIRL